MTPHRKASARAGLDPGCAARVFACAAIDALAAAMLLLQTSLTPATVGLAAATHAVAIVLLFGVMRARASRASLGAAAAFAVPGAGVAVAAAVILTKGRDRVRRHCGPGVPRHATPTTVAFRRLGHALCPCDALEGDEEQRRSALSALARRADHDAIALLQRASAAADPDLALAAALALDEIGERFERSADRLDPEEPRRAAG
jgi:HEAT repeat protein